MSKLTIEIDDDSVLPVRVFVDGKEIGVVKFDGGNYFSLIKNLTLYVEPHHKVAAPKINIVLSNFLGGLYESMHKEVIECIRDTAKELDKLSFDNDLSMTLQLNRDRLFEKGAGFFDFKS